VSFAGWQPGRPTKIVTRTLQLSWALSANAKPTHIYYGVLRSNTSGPTGLMAASTALLQLCCYCFSAIRAATAAVATA